MAKAPDPQRAPVGQRVQAEKTWPTKTVSVTYSMYPRDDAMVRELSEYFGGTSQSDIIRTAIRTLYVKLLGKNA